MLIIVVLSWKVQWYLQLKLTCLWLDITTIFVKEKKLQNRHTLLTECYSLCSSTFNWLTKKSSVKAGDFFLPEESSLSLRFGFCLAYLDSANLNSFRVLESSSGKKIKNNLKKIWYNENTFISLLKY